MLIDFAQTVKAKMKSARQSGAVEEGITDILLCRAIMPIVAAEYSFADVSKKLTKELEKFV